MSIKKFSLWISLIIIIFYFPEGINKLEGKYFSLKNYLERRNLVENQNCENQFIDFVPENSSLIIGHAYGSPKNNNGFISESLSYFLKKNQSKINTIFFTGDIFAKPNKKKWETLKHYLGNNIRIIVAPGNHDIGAFRDRLAFEESVRKLSDYPFIVKIDKSIFVIENSFQNGWLANSEILELINSLSPNSNIFLLRHNIIANEFLPLSNSREGLNESLHSIRDMQKLFKRELTIISGDGGAFKYLPRFFCRIDDKITYIINGVGELKGDIILILWNNNIYKYVLNK